MEVLEKLKIISYNCKNVKTSVKEIQELCSNSDIVFLQETWLADFEIPFLSRIDSNFHATGLSEMDSSKTIHKGRPFGGLGILWRKSLCSEINVVKYDDSRILGVEIRIRVNSDNYCNMSDIDGSQDCSYNVGDYVNKNNICSKFLLLNVNLPCDDGSNLEDFMFYL